MKNIKRAVFFWTLVALFLMVAPAIVLNATGYRFDFDRGVFVHSGTITLKSNPQDFAVILDGEVESPAKINRMNSSYNLTGLIPKEYEIAVSAPGFQKWSKKAMIHSGLSTEFWNILLVRDAYEKTAYGTDGAEKFFVSPKSGSVIHTLTDSSGTGASILDIKNKTIEKKFHFAGWRFVNDFRKENIEWSPQEDRLSIPLERIVPTFKPVSPKSAPEVDMKAEYAYFVIAPDSETSFNLNEFLGKKDLSNVRWDPKDKNYLFFLSEGNLFRAHISDSSNVVQIASNVSSFDLSSSNVYWSQMPNELVFRANLDGKSGLVQITHEFPAEVSEPTERLIVYDDGRIAFLNKNKDLYIYNKGEAGSYFKKIGSNTEGLQFSDDGKKLLFWSNNEISVYFIRKWVVQPERNENDIQNITRYSEQLKNVQWFKDYEHVIFSAGPEVKLIELDARDRRITMDLLKTDMASPFIIYVHNLERLFFTDKKENGTDIFSIIFPEQTSILGIL